MCTRKQTPPKKPTGWKRSSVTSHTLPPKLSSMACCSVTSDTRSSSYFSHNFCKKSTHRKIRKHTQPFISQAHFKQKIDRSMGGQIKVQDALTTETNVTNKNAKLNRWVKLKAKHLAILVGRFDERIVVSVVTGAWMHHDREQKVVVVNISKTPLPEIPSKKINMSFSGVQLPIVVVGTKSGWPNCQNKMMETTSTIWTRPNPGWQIGLCDY